MTQDTIAAIATPIGSGGIGIIRISGIKAVEIASILFRAKPLSTGQAAQDVTQWHSHTLKYGYICDPQTHQPVDEVLLVIMKAPHSYTREDVVEIQSHSGPAILAKLLQLVLTHDARLAEPGEFTRRAFENGRIDLSQAEAVADMINARTDSALQLASAHLQGLLKETIHDLAQTLEKIFTNMQAIIEFPDDVENDFDAQRTARHIHQDLIQPIVQLLEQYKGGHFFRDGIRLDIVGRPNVGKSSLLNRLLRKDKAIVTPIPGTTRDLVEDFFSIRGIPIMITDTAGLQASDDPVEIIGIQKTKENIARSDLVLFVIDAQDLSNPQDLEVYHQITAKRVIVVINKIDLAADKKSLTITDRFMGRVHALVSARTGEGLDELCALVADQCLGNITIQPGQHLVVNLRQQKALQTTLNALTSAYNGLQQGVFEELVVEDLQFALDALHHITGENVDKDILDQIFERFCIGK